MWDVPTATKVNTSSMPKREDPWSRPTTLATTWPVGHMANGRKQLPLPTTTWATPVATMIGVSHVPNLKDLLFVHSILINQWICAPYCRARTFLTNFCTVVAYLAVHLTVLWYLLSWWYLVISLTRMIHLLLETSNKMIYLSVPDASHWCPFVWLLQIIFVALGSRCIAIHMLSGFNNMWNNSNARIITHLVHII
jgi:hypothetical protein